MSYQHKIKGLSDTKRLFLWCEKLLSNLHYIRDYRLNKKTVDHDCREWCRYFSGYWVSYLISGKFWCLITQLPGAGIRKIWIELKSFRQSVATGAVNGLHVIEVKKKFNRSGVFLRTTEWCFSIRNPAALRLIDLSIFFRLNLILIFSCCIHVLPMVLYFWQRYPLAPKFELQ